MGDSSLRDQIIHIAYVNPQFRDDLLPLVREAAEGKEAYLVDTFNDPFVRTWPKLLTEISRSLEMVDFKTFRREEGNSIVTHPEREVPVKIKSLKGPAGIALRDKLFAAWKKPRAQRNWKRVVSYLAKNTGNRAQEVGRNLQKSLGEILTSGDSRAKAPAQSVWSSVAGAYRRIDQGMMKYVDSEVMGGNMRLASSGELATERELRAGLIRLAYGSPEVRSDILEILNDND